MRNCFRDVGLEAPDMSVYLPRLARKKPPQIIKNVGGYRLAGALRRALDKKLGDEPVITAITDTLATLPAKLPDLNGREFLVETLKCYKVRAYRATIVMVWNLAYDHLIRWIFTDAGRISALNGTISTTFLKKSGIKNIEDFYNFKEVEIIELCRASNLLDKNTIQVLRDKLARRNMAAHPSRVIISQHQADDAISDLVNNIILRLL